MRLELDKDSRILGTKKSSPKGQISGLTKYAGEEVLVILLGGGGTTAVRAGPEEIVSELQRSMNEHMGLLFKQYERLRETFNTPAEATKQFLKVTRPKVAGNLFEQMDTWVNKVVKRIPGQKEKETEE